MKPIRPTKLGIFPKLADGVHDVALANCTQYRISIASTARGRFIGVEGRGAYEFQSPAHWAYVKEKLGLRFDGDAQNLADFINAQLGIENFTTQGSYNEDLCIEAISRKEVIPA